MEIKKEEEEEENRNAKAKADWWIKKYENFKSFIKYSQPNEYNLVFSFLMVQKSSFSYPNEGYSIITCTP